MAKPKEEEKPAVRGEDALRSVLARHDLRTCVSPTPLTVTDLEGNIVDCNEATLRIHGYASREELIGKSAFSLIAKRDHERAMENLMKTLKQGSVEDLEYALLTRNGREFPAELSANVIRDSSGKPVGFVAATKDITERKVMEEELRRRAELLNAATDSIVLHDVDGNILYVNEAFCKMRGLSRDMLMKTNLFSIVPPQFAGQITSRVREIMEKGEATFETGAVRKDGSIIPVEVHSRVIRSNGRRLVLSVARDITERLKAEEGLRDAEEKWLSLTTNTDDIIMIVDSRGVIQYINKTIPPYTPEQTIGRTVYEYVPKEQHPIMRESLDRVFATGEPDNYEVSSRIPQAGTIWFSTKVVPVKRNGRVADVIMISEAITERKRMEEELKTRAQLLDAATDGILLNDLDGNIIYANEACHKVRGYTREELLKMNVKALFPPGYNGLLEPEVKRLMERGEATFESVIIGRDGSRMPMEVSASVIESGGRRLVLSVGRDITERRRLEEMKSRFISVATHELRTPLVSIKGYVDYILTGKLGTVPKNVKPSLEVVQRNTDRLLRITDDLLDIQRLASGRLPLYLAPMNFREIIDDCAKAVQPLFDERRQSFHLEAPDGPLLIQGDHIRLSQVVMNLLSNAVKFTPQGGEITVHVEDREDAVQVQVLDTGIGIRKEDLQRVFEPLADIKKPSYIKGTGLGLSVAKGLVEAHGGKMWAYSEGEGKGSTFTFTLPKQRGKEAS